ncbi:enoyl-CoA hydratase/isomerase family protein [Pigmentiphaga sp.]|uniref:enoyl-CoA hydratase/isomerase family protein n=1 Tax=Pigmentiphaga sp. TaxID=1977564 RepID=UPI00128B9EEA|nr:enoyl-CoA hydratase/isomerase family protein [Pigmentiphaga sp.]MPS29976.1 enoyl-CoA hydratase/isomerase family protein [Alcaligenaceae bacterium SAGV5]MPS53459.1 enoyl-CoA hydratase/isomerase family protein [Alcaligenaceae bacterium SAGV3]MPT58251.1 enoyl-CoA hydratase/isomerase family protein [Alcaligenaceae bacterium]
MSEPVLVRSHSGLLDIVLNTPGNGNLMSAEMGQLIIDAVSNLDEQVRLIRVSGEGEDFCAGRVSPMPKPGSTPTGEALRRNVAMPALALYDALKMAPVPVLSVVHGKAYGVGCALAGVCDITLAADDASFQIPEMERDIPPALVMSALIGRVPMKTIARMVLTRDLVGAREAWQAGLASEVVPRAELRSRADRIAATILECSPVTVRAVKQFMELAPGLPVGTSSSLAGHLSGTALSAKFERPA